MTRASGLSAARKTVAREKLLFRARLESASLMQSHQDGMEHIPATIFLDALSEYAATTGVAQMGQHLMLAGLCALMWQHHVTLAQTAMMGMPAQMMTARGASVRTCA